MRVTRLPAAALPSGGSPGQVLGLDGAGKLAWLAMGSGTTPGNVAYSHYRLNVTATASEGYPSLSELILRDAATGTRLTGGVGSGDSYNNSSHKAFDGDPGTRWVGAAPGVSILKYTLPGAVAVDQYLITFGGYDSAPKTWTLEGSNDGAIWTVLHTVADAGAWADGQTKTYTI